VLNTRTFPRKAGILLGLGLGGFFDGIVLHQLLQWHHMVSTWYPITNLRNLEINTRWDGVFHSLTYLLVLAGVINLWRSGYRPAGRGDRRAWAGCLLIGWGAFNVVEGLVSHQFLGVHHVNETVALDQRWIWDLTFFLWGDLMLIAGALLSRGGVPVEANA
jgi:uncharacterized membrane protein